MTMVVEGVEGSTAEIVQTHGCLRVVWEEGIPRDTGTSLVSSVLWLKAAVGSSAV